MPSPTLASAGACVELRARYLSAQRTGDRRAALRVVEDGLGQGVSVNALQLEVIQAAQHEIGRLWQENRISIAQEHMATAISHMALAHLYDEAERAPENHKRVLVACVQGELHDFPARLVADALDLAGFDVRYLGADVPTPNLIDMLLQEPPDLLALSATMHFNFPSLQSAVLRIRERVGRSLPIMVGGAALTAASSGSAQPLAIDGTAANAPEMVARARQLLGLAS